MGLTGARRAPPWEPLTDAAHHVRADPRTDLSRILLAVFHALLMAKEKLFRIKALIFCIILEAQCQLSASRPGRSVFSSARDPIHLWSLRVDQPAPEERMPTSLAIGSFTALSRTRVSCG